MKHEHNNLPPCDTIFDRLVDGELTDAQRKQLLATLDDREHGWRDCALAFLEAQAWNKQFNSLLIDNQERPATLTPTPAPQERVRSGQWLTLAAGLLVAFSVGWLANSSVDPQPEQETVVVVDTKTSPLQEELNHSNDAVTLLVRDTQGVNRRLQVPLLDVESLNQQLADRIPEQLRASFLDRGFDIQHRRRFAPMFFEQNEQLVPMVVPVDDTRIVPVHRPIY